MPDIVFHRVFRAAGIEQFEHLVFECHAIVTLDDDVILMEYVTQKVAVIQLQDDRRLDMLRQPFEPVAIVAA